MEIESGKFYTMQQVADILGLKILTIKNYVKEGKITSYKFDRARRIKGEDLIKFLEERKEG